MYKIISAKFIAPEVKKFVIEAPKIARKRKAGQFVIIRIDEHGERIPLTLHGKVQWISYVEAKDQYFIGVQFNPYGEKQGENYPGNMVKIIALEQKYAIKEKAKTVGILSTKNEDVRSLRYLLI